MSKDPQPWWYKEFCELDGSISSTTQKRYLKFIHSVVEREVEAFRDKILRLLSH